MLFITMQRDLWDYYLFPKLKALDGYIYPQLRYTIYDVAIILWCIDGLAACVLLFRNIPALRTIRGWSYRTTLAFFVGFGVLVIGGFFGMCLRSMRF
jgi:hypothetical protein